MEENAYHWLPLLLHGLARGLLLYKLLGERSCRGVSRVTQELIAVLYVARGIDMLWMFEGAASEAVKAGHLFLAIVVVGVMRYSPKVLETYDADCDTVPHAFMLVPPFILALVFHKLLLFAELLHAFSWYLEAIVLIPQFVLLYRRQKYESWVLLLTMLHGTEALLTSVPIMYNWHESQLKEPYDLLASVMQATVYLGGFSMLLWRHIESKPVLNDSADKLAFETEKVYDASAFEFSEEQKPPPA